MEIHLKDVHVHSAAVDHRPGGATNPLTTEQTIRKFMRLATAVMSEAQADRIVQMVAELENLRDVGLLPRELSPREPARRVRQGSL